ncbi:MAG: hypothetical protein M3083_22250 [Actinomycetota bacterium]|nr:hypothetical protein [Actinomycetota bacterium]
MTWWTGPDSSIRSLFDVAPLTRLAVLTTDSANWANPRLLAEMRLIEDRHGLNPAARAALARLGVSGAPAPPPAPPAPRKAPGARKAAALHLLDNNDDGGKDCA